MKKLITITFSLLFSLCVGAQQDTTINGTTFTADGKVGIGNSNPTQPLYVTGSAVFRDGENLDVAIAKPAGKNGIIFNAQYNNPDYNYVNYSRFNMYNFPKPNALYRYFFMGFHGQPGIAIKLGGFVGLGTVNPLANLEIKSKNNQDSELHIHAASGSKRSGIRFKDAGTNRWSFFSNWPSVGSLSLTNHANADRAMVVTADGNIGFGVDNPESKLVVDGTIVSEEIKVEVVNAPDYVFAKNYNLITLQEVASYIEQHSHLPEIPSAAEMESEGVELGLMNMRLLKKVEELTLYTIDQENELQEQRAMMQELLKEMAVLREEVREGKE